MKYFEDTVLPMISGYPVFETKEINEHIYLDSGNDGNHARMTIDHALPQANGHEILFPQINRQVA